MNDIDTARRCAEAMLSRDRSSRMLGITVEVSAPGQAVARMTVRDDLVNGFDVLHGGLMFALADTAFAFACNAYDDVTVAGAASIDFLRPVFLGDELKAVALEEHRGRRGGVYAVEVINQHGEFRRGLDYFYRAVDAMPDHAQNWINLIKVLVAMHRADEAEQQLERFRAAGIPGTSDRDFALLADQIDEARNISAGQATNQTVEEKLE